MTLCGSNRYNPYGYFDLKILSEYGEYANSLCEFVLNTIVVDYVVRISKRNNKNLLDKIQSNNPVCISFNSINLDTDFIPYGEKMRRICAMSKSTLYDLKTTRLIHPSWTVRFLPNYKRILRVFASNLRHLVKKVGDIEEYVSKVNLNGDIIRYRAISAALTTVKYDLLTLYATIRSGRVTAMKTSFLYPILNDLQRWLAYSYYQIKIILSTFPGSTVNRNLKSKLKSMEKFHKTFEKSETNSMISQTEQSSINQDI